MQRYSVGSRLAHLLGVDDARRILASRVRGDIDFLDEVAGVDGLSHKMVCDALTAFYGFGILFNAEIRTAILANVPMSTLGELASCLVGWGEILPSDPRQLQLALMNRAVHPGTMWARHLCEVLDLPLVCAGERDTSERPAMESMAPRIVLPPLHSYQTNIAEKIRRLLAEPHGPRAMIALPTGAGKTRLLLETMLNWQPIQNGDGALVWVAQHEELCEQAIACISQIWASEVRPSNRLLKIQRVWGSKSSEIDWLADVIVGIPESLSPRIQRDRLTGRRRIAATIIDEAHLSDHPAYEEIFKVASAAPLLGISATPAKTNDPNGALPKIFFNRLITSDELGNHPLAALRKRGVISEIHYINVDTAAVIELTEDDRMSVSHTGDFQKSLLERVGKSIQRNRAISSALLNIPLGKPTLCFMSSVASARALAAAMTIEGRTAAVVDASTPRNLRHRILDQFRNGDIQFLFNFEVLAVGFDAPKVEYLVMARPTRSPILLEQMLGRGIRGPANGGTEECHVIWITDDFANAEALQPLSYGRFSDMWSAA